MNTNYVLYFFGGLFVALWACVLFLFVVAFRAKARRRLKLGISIGCAGVVLVFAFVFFIPLQRTLALLYKERWKELAHYERVTQWNLHHITFGQYQLGDPGLLADTIAKSLSRGLIRDVDDARNCAIEYTRIENNATRAKQICDALIHAFPEKRYDLTLLFADWAADVGATDLEKELARRVAETVSDKSAPIDREELISCAILLAIDKRTTAALELIGEARQIPGRTDFLDHTGERIRRGERVRVEWMPNYPRCIKAYLKNQEERMRRRGPQEKPTDPSLLT